MKILKILLFQLFILTACNANGIEAFKSKEIDKAPSTVKNLIKSTDKNCFTLYNVKKIWILEQHCPEKNTKQGIYLIDALGKRKFNWYDSAFNNWAWQEGCNSDKDCYYKITINNNGEVTELAYHFFINLSEGFYKLKIKNNKLIVSEKKIIDHPS